MKGFYYLATPYSIMPGDAATALEDRYREAKRITAKLLQNNVWVFSPIVHCHPLVEDNELPTGFEFWNEYDATMIANSAGVLVVTIPGWKSSRGVAHEINLAESMKLPVGYLCPKTFAITWRLPA